MPLFGALFASVFTALVGFFVRFASYQIAVKLAAYTTWVAVFSAFLVAVFVCVSNLLAMFTGAAGSGGSWVRLFWMGVGMFIPSNATAVMSCLGSVWVATNVYMMQQRAIVGYAK